VTLVDTAGIRDSVDPIEQEGVARARRRAGSADLTLWLDDGAGRQIPGVGSPVLSVRTKIDLVTDSSPVVIGPPPAPPLWGRDGVGGRADGGRPVVSAEVDTVAKNRRRRRDPPPDLPHKGGGARSTGVAGAKFAISAKTGAGVDQLLDALAELAEERMSSREPALLTVERHRYAFQDARDALAATLGPDAAEWELIAEDLRRAAAAMDRIVGRIGAEEVLGEIFARLCVGK